jgi:hypothetical protein
MARKNFINVLSRAAVVAMLTTVIAPAVSAAERDVYDLNSKSIVYKYSDYSKNIKLQREIAAKMAMGPSKYGYELNDQVYKMTDVNKQYLTNDKDVSKTFEAVKSNETAAFAATNVEEGLKVESVSAINAKQVVVKFSKAIDEDTVIDNDKKLQNITFGEIGTATALGDLYAELSKDGKTLTVTADTEQSGEIFKGRYTVTVDEAEVKDVDGNPIAKYSEIKTFEDKVRPTLVKVSYGYVPATTGESAIPGYKTAILEFSEPVDISDLKISAARVDGVALNAGTVLNESKANYVANSNNKKIVIKLDAVNKADVNKDIKLTITGLVDYAKNLATPNPLTTTIKYEDTSAVKAAKVESVTVKDNNTLVVKFDKALATDPKATDIKIGTAETVAKTVTKDKKDATKYEVSWENALPKGLQTLVIPVVTDINGNKSEGESKLINIVLDEELPVLKSTKVEKINGTEYLVLTYDENVTPVDGKDVDVEYVKDYVTIEKTINTTGNLTRYNPVDEKSKAVKLDLSSLTDSAEYTAKLPEGLVTKDINGKNSEEKTGVKFTRTADVVTGEMKVTSFAQSATDNNIIDVTFDKKVDPQSALNKANYSVEGVTIESVKLTENKADSAKVELKLAKGSSKFTGARTVVVSGIKNEAGQVMETYNKVIDINENIAPTIEKAELTATDKITVTFSEDVYGSVTTADTDFELYIGGVKSTTKTLRATAAADTDSADDELVLTVSDALTAEELAQGVTIKFVKGSGIKDIVDNKLDAPSAIKVTVAK